MAAKKNTIIKTEGIKISTGGEDASEIYGGYPYSLQYSINFTAPSRMTVSFVSENGEYNEDALQKRIFPEKSVNPNITLSNGPTSRAGGAITFDTITFGNEKFNMHPMRYTIQDGPSGRFLVIEYYDRSIAFLDKVIVALEGKHYPPAYLPSYLANYGVNTNVNRMSGGAPTSPYIIGLGNPYLPKSVAQDSGVLPKPTVGAQSKYLCPEYLYSPYELYQGILRNPIMNGTGNPASKGPHFDGSLELLWWFGKFALEGQDGVNWGSSSTSEDPDALYLKNFHGTLREVLQQWGQKFGFMFYWESQQGEDKLKLMNLRDGSGFSKINKVVSDLSKNNLSNVINLSKSYSIEETSSRGAASYICMEGGEAITPFQTSMKNLDLITVPIWRCGTKAGAPRRDYKEDAAEDCNLYDMGTRAKQPEVESRRYYLPNYCETDCKAGQGCDYANPFEMISTSTIRSNKTITVVAGNQDKNVKSPLILASYVRLLKAALISPEFYRAYVLLKKSNSYANQGFSSLEDYDGYNLNNINNWNFDINDVPGGAGGFHTDGLDGGADSKFQIVNQIYPSGGPGGLENSLGYFNLLCYPRPGNRFNDTKGFKVWDLEEDNQMTSWNYTLGRDCISLQRVASKQFEQLVFNDDRIRQAVGVSSSDSDKRGRGDDKTRHFNIYRLKKYGNTQLIQEPQEDHIYKLLKTIATHQGRFYYHAGLISKQDFAARTYVDKNLTWIDRETCVNNSPFAALQDGIDPLSEERKKEMPNACVGFKKRESKQRDAKNKPFKNGNLANFTVEQFIQQVYAETITGIDPIQQAVLTITGLTAGGAIKGIAIVDGGEGYRNGTLPVRIKGANTFAADATATVAGGRVTAIALGDGGAGYKEDVSASIEGFSGKGAGGTYNVFGEKQECEALGEGHAGGGKEAGASRECMDCITPSNLAVRDNQYKDGIKKGRKTVCSPPDSLGIIYSDFGPNELQIPAGVADQIERFEKGFYLIPATHPADIVRFHNEASMQLLILPSVGKPGTSGVTIGGDYKAGDELDWILDQVSIPNLDMVLMAESKERVKPKKGLDSFIGLTKREDPTVRNKDEVAYNATWLGRGPKFEQAALVEPIFQSNVASVKFQEVKPTAQDLGVEDVECVPAKKRAEKIKEDQKKMKKNIRNYTEMYAYHEGDVQVNVRLTVMGDGLQDAAGNPLVITIGQGLEGIGAQVDGDGVVFSYTIGTRRKQRILEAPNSSMWLKVKPEFFNNVFDI
jgi:hypothetical protein